MATDSRGSLRTWLLPLLLLLGAALVVFVFTFLIDTGGDLGPLSLLVRPNPEVAAGTIASAGEVLAAVLGIAITVV
ncbi:MAG: hypothetical protein AAF447_19400, partial [Myxococcota bacterium]